MAKATLKLPNGPVVTLEGTPQEVRQLLEMYSGQQPALQAGGQGAAKREARQSRMPSRPAADASGPDLSQIVNQVKNCQEAEGIEKNILDRASMVDRVLLPLYVVHEHYGNQPGLTSGEIDKITTELGVRVSQPNASRTLSDTASRYVVGDKVRKKGQAVRYRLSRRGTQYLKSVISGASDGK